MESNARAVADKIMHEISVNEHFIEELRSNPEVALSSIGIVNTNAEEALNDMDWDAPDVAEQLEERINKLFMV